MTTTTPSQAMRPTVDQGDAQPGRPAESAAVTAMQGVLRVNVTVTMLSAVVLVAGAGQIADALGTSHAGWIRLVGVGLAAFAVGVWALSRVGDVRRLRAGTLAVALADIGWVAASAITIAAGWYDGPGALLVAAVAVVIGVLAVAELSAARRTLR